jgi:glycogen(starch) synthase
LGVTYTQGKWVSHDELLDLLQDYDLCVVPSRGFESFGMIALDAESAGLPLVLPNSGGLAEVAADGKNAVYYERENVGALAAAVHSLARDPKKRTEYSAISRRIVQTRFSVSRHIDLLLRAYSQTQGSHR